MGATRRFGLGFQFVADQRLDSAVAEGDVVLASQVLLNLAIARKTAGIVQAGSELRADVGRNRARFAGRFLNCQRLRRIGSTVRGSC